MAEYLSPGVYVEEFDSGIKAMEGVGTSTAGFVGMAQKGPIQGLPVLITSMADYQRRFGGYLPERTYGDMRFLPYAVEQFFNNGGSSCYVMRVCGDAASAKGVFVGVDKENQFLELCASNPGAWGSRLQAKLAAVLKNRAEVTGVDGAKVIVKDAGSYQQGDIACLQTITTVQTDDKSETSVTLSYHYIDSVEGSAVTLQGDLPAAENAERFLYLVEWNVAVGDDTAAEQYEGISLNPARSNYAEQAMEKSQLVTVSVQTDKLKEIGTLLGDAKEPSISIVFEGGNDGEIKPDQSENVQLYIGEDGSPDQRTGLMAFKTLSDVSIMAIPGITDKAVQSALVSHCENMGNRFAILDMPADAKEVSALQEFRENIDSNYAAMYHPWLQCYDPLVNRNVFLPPSGSMAGIYGRTDNTRGVHKAPANEVVRNCMGLSVKYNEAEQGKLNPKGINLIRQLPGQGIRVWGARTCSSDGNWKYVNVRRLFIFIEESIKANTNWAVFEPNDEILWSRVEGTIRVFLTTQWRNGALAGTTADEAFFINIGKSTMTEDDILNGRLICVIGVAPVRPAEFVVFRITQKMESAQ
ncbi:MAG: phage tail sheath subtilisin-like domain-containing protein [Acetatifactor sp.]|nr:phage tail sheath subtilisin-like domain-containing protein [Acetatifactor sp.]MDE7114182.1 phage tail sheath subtilisin-like domain-containing protein [Acetatifactor sp.]